MNDYGYYDYGTSYGTDSLATGVGAVLGGLAIFLVIVLIIALVVAIVQLVAQWKLYKKAGKDGWEAIVPFYTNWVLVEIAGLKWYWFLGFFGPLVLGAIPGIGFLGSLAYLFTMFNIFYNLSKKFNKGIGFAICATLFTPICIMILGFSKKMEYDKNVPVSPHGVFGKPESSTPNTAPVAPVVSEPTVTPVQPGQPVTPEVQQSTPAFCTSCGSALMPGSKFCTNCGKQI